MILRISVPLSGLTSVNDAMLLILAKTIIISVPLSGLTSVNMDKKVLVENGVKFPSPYRG